jgi:hypothetical protein
MQSSEIHRASKFGPERIRLHSSGANLEQIDATIGIVTFVDKDTNLYVAYAPSLEVSGYGKNLEEAHSMAKASIDEALEMIGRLPERQ